MRIRVPAPTLLSRITPDTDKDWKGYAISNIANVSIQTDGIVIDGLLMKQINANTIQIRDANDTLDRMITASDIKTSGNFIFWTNGGGLCANDLDDNYAVLKARENTVGLAEIARLQGAATPTFDIRAGRLTGDFNCNGYNIADRHLASGNVIASSADTQQSTSNTTYTKVKEIETSIGGTFRIKFDLWSSSSADTAYGQIYKNGSAFGTERTTTNTSPTTFTEDLNFEPGDLIQLYIKQANSSETAFTQNFRVCVSEVEEWTVNLD